MLKKHFWAVLIILLIILIIVSLNRNRGIVCLEKPILSLAQPTRKVTLQITCILHFLPALR